MERERRFIPVDGIEVRESEDGTPTGIAGLGAVFGSRTTIGRRFDEEIAETFFDDVMDDPEIVGLFNHDPNMVLGRTGAGTMRLRKTREGMKYEVPNLPESRADVLEAINRRDVTGNSFSFSMPEDESGEDWILPEDREDGGTLPLRILRRAEKIFDFGPVTFPAYKATTVSARSAERAAKLTEAEKRAVRETCGACETKNERIQALLRDVEERDERIAQMIRLRDRERQLLS